MAKLLPVEVFDLILFGGTGDLAMRKLLPALYHRSRDAQVTADSRIISTGRTALNRDEYLALVEESLRANLRSGEFEDEHWQSFRDRIEYVQSDALDPDNWQELATVINAGTDRVRVAYLATAPSLFGAIAKGLSQNQLITDDSRIVVEKPLGHDHASAYEINNEVGACFSENQIFRIDHYLGKETVQNLLALLFGNSLF